MPLDLNYHHLYYFWICVRFGSLTAAARELHLSQSALSLQLQSLERSLGRRLLERSRSGVTPTADGLDVFERCERIFPEGEALTEAMRTGGPRAPVFFRIGQASGTGRWATLGVLDRLQDIEGLTPTISFGVADDVVQRLMRRSLDAGLFSADPASRLGRGFRSRRLDSAPLLFAASPALARRTAPFPRRGREYPMLLRPADHPVRQKVDLWLRERGARALVVAETADTELLKALAVRGRGIALMTPASAEPELSAGRLARVPGGAVDFVHEVWAAVPARAPLDAPAAAAAEAVMRGGLLGRDAAVTRSRRDGSAPIS